MVKGDEDPQKPLFLDENEDEKGGETGGSSTGSGGKTGEIVFRFRDAMSLPPRDDMLPPSEIRRLLIVHKDLHKERVTKQKNTRQDRAAIKEGRTIGYRHGQGQGYNQTNYKKHPISNKAQFSGIDKQTQVLPTQFEAETNNEMRDKLENRFTHRNMPRFHPKPRPV